MSNTDNMEKVIGDISSGLYATSHAIRALGVNPAGYGPPVGAADVLSDAILEAGDKIANGLYAVAESLKSCSDQISHLESISNNMEVISEKI